MTKVLLIPDVWGIVGGVDSNIIDVPYQVSLRRSSQHICGGGIISDRHILTAGHCIAGIFSSPFTELTVASGSSTLNGPANVHFVDNVIVHPGYVPRTSTQRVKNDIAIIIVKNNTNIYNIILTFLKIYILSYLIFLLAQKSN